MKLINKDYLNKYKDEDYVWYACYGSNINYKRFMYYINGDPNKKYSESSGCKDKSLPKEERQYVFENPIYFAGHSKKWGCGVAFLDYEHKGKSYGKIYKIKMNQFKEILEQEQKNKLYDAILIVDYIDDLPVFTFSAKHKLYDLLNKPSDLYIEVIKKGLMDLYDEKDQKEINIVLEKYEEI